MTSPFVLFAITLASCVAAATVGGVFYAFSTFVMRSLADLGAAEAVSAMQRINIRVINPWFVTPFFAAALLPATGALLSYRLAYPVAGTWLLAGTLIWVVTVIGVTTAFNVPRNERLANLDVAAPSAAAYWPRYQREWLLWNHARTLGSLLAFVCDGLALASLTLR